MPEKLTNAINAITPEVFTPPSHAPHADTLDNIFSTADIGDFDLGGEAFAGMSVVDLYQTGEEVGLYKVCFAAGTRVLMADGTTKAIETIRPGERVFSVSEDEPDGAVVASEVVRVFHNEPQPILELSIDGHLLHTTSNHPFHVPNVGWTAASSLEPGMCFRTPNGQIARLDKTTPLPNPAPVFNLQIAATHTYFVQPLDSDTAVLVHNASEAEVDSDSESIRLYRRYARRCCVTNARI